MSLVVSPTYRSGEYFTPLNKPKKRPSRRQAKDNWGFNAKSYGGIGELLLNKSQKVSGKGLLVSRGHHHVGSGVHKLHPVSQPYQVTSLIKSACRPSDQVLPDINKLDLVSIAKELSLLSDKAWKNNSFQPIFDVFPRFDISQDETRGNMDESLNQRKKLTARTVQALQGITTDTYKTSSNQRDYGKELEQTKPKEKLKKTVTFKTPLPMPERMGTFHDVSTQPREEYTRCAVCGCKISLEDFYEGLNDMSICSFCKSTGIFRVGLRRDQLSEKANVTAAVAPLTLAEFRRFMGSRFCDKGKSSCMPDKIADKEAEAVYIKPAKPVGQTQVFTSPLNYLGYYSGRQRSRMPVFALTRNSIETEMPEDKGGTTNNYLGNEVLLKKRMDLERVSIPISLKNKLSLKEKGMYSSNAFLMKESGLRKASLKEVLPMTYFPLGNGSNEEDKLKVIKVTHKETRNSDNATEVNGDTEKAQYQSPPAVIKTYKSLANKRYHENHPDAIPDLRDSRIDSKKYFFSGYHTSVFRG